MWHTKEGAHNFEDGGKYKSIRCGVHLSSVCLNKKLQNESLILLQLKLRLKILSGLGSDEGVPPLSEVFGSL